MFQTINCPVTSGFKIFLGTVSFSNDFILKPTIFENNSD